MTPHQEHTASSSGETGETGKQRRLDLCMSVQQGSPSSKRAKGQSPRESGSCRSHRLGRTMSLWRAEWVWGITRRSSIAETKPCTSLSSPASGDRRGRVARRVSRRPVPVSLVAASTSRPCDTDAGARARDASRRRSDRASVCASGYTAVECRPRRGRTRREPTWSSMRVVSCSFVFRSFSVFRARFSMRRYRFGFVTITRATTIYRVRVMSAVGRFSLVRPAF